MVIFFYVAFGIYKYIENSREYAKQKRLTLSNPSAYYGTKQGMGAYPFYFSFEFSRLSHFWWVLRWHRRSMLRITETAKFTKSGFVTHRNTIFCCSSALRTRFFLLNQCVAHKIFSSALACHQPNIECLFLLPPFFFCTIIPNQSAHRTFSLEHFKFSKEILRGAFSSFFFSILNDCFSVIFLF